MANPQNPYIKEQHRGEAEKPLSDSLEKCPICNSVNIISKYQDQQFNDGRLDILNYNHCNSCNHNWRPTE